jgi:decaprenylphospho-beta-D-erythro-pentofuranosid-2-ulose 2-reductase
MRDALGNVQGVLVLGGTSDIGVAIAGRLAGPRHAAVVLAGRDPDGSAMIAAAERVSTAGASKVDRIGFDALDTNNHPGVVERAAELLGGDVDVAVVAFGVLGDQSAAERDPRASLDIARVNYDGAVSAMVALAEHLRAQGHGTIVYLSSVAGERVRRSNFAYGSSKAGADGFALGLGEALRGSGVEVLVVRPGFVKTKMTAGMDEAPLATSAEAVAAATADGLARHKEIVWVPGTLRYVMMGMRHVPRAMFRRLPV